VEAIPVRVVRSGRRHRIGNAHILVAMANAPVPTLVETEDGSQLYFLGLDDRGVELHVIAVPDNRREGGLLDGRRLTNELAEKMAREGAAEARRRDLIPGGKSLAGDGSHSPRVQFRVPESLRAAAEAKAAAEGVSLSVLAREALEHYLAS